MSWADELVQVCSVFGRHMEGTADTHTQVSGQSLAYIVLGGFVVAVSYSRIAVKLPH